MEPTEFDDFGQRLTVLGEIFNAGLSPARIALYFEALRDLQLADVVRALNVAARKNTFMPKPAELRAIVTGDDDDAAIHAWHLLKRAMGHIGSWSSVVFEDAALAETVLALWASWPAACELDLTPEMWASQRNDFVRVYRIHRNRALTGERYLLGICEQQNAGHDEWMRYVRVERLTAAGAVQRVSIEAAAEIRARMIAAAKQAQLEERAS